MTFEEFLKKLNMTAADFKDLPPEAKDYINASFYATAQKAKAAEEKAKQQALKKQKALDRCLPENIKKHKKYEILRKSTTIFCRDRGGNPRRFPV